MMMRKSAVGIIAVLLMAAVCQAGSIFSGGGVGLWKWTSSGRDAGMGILGFGMRDSSSVGAMNPAVWSGITMTRFSAGMGIHHFSSQDDFASDQSDDFALEYAALGMSLKKNLTIGVRFYPQSRIDYRRYETAAIGNLVFSDYNIGKGGISTGTFLLAGKVKEDLDLGLSLDFIFGSLSTLWGADFASSTISDVQYTLAKKLFGVRPAGGFLFQLNEKTTIGGYGALGVNVPVTEELDYSYSDSTSEQDLDFSYPNIAGVGFQHYLRPRLILAGDVLWAGWQKRNQEIGDSDRYQTAVCASAGMEIVPLNETLVPIYQKLAYRWGVSYQALYYQSPAGQTVNDFAVSAGLGIPLEDVKSRLDITFTLGKRGDLDTNNAEEIYYRMGFYINTGEKWFVRTKKY